ARWRSARWRGGGPRPGDAGPGAGRRSPTAGSQSPAADEPRRRATARQARGARPRMSRDAGAVRRLAHAARPGTAPEAGKPSAGGGNRAGRAGLALIALSIAATAATGLAGPSAMEPALPGRPGQPPWDLGLHLPPAAAVGLAAVALAAGTAGLGLCLHAIRRGWAVSPRMVLAAGLVAAAVITLAPPFGSSDQLSYAAYGRMVIT